MELAGRGAPENKEHRVTVMVVQPDAEICCGLQESKPALGEGGAGNIQTFSDRQAASKLVDAHSEAEQAGAAGAQGRTSRNSA